MDTKLKPGDWVRVLVTTDDFGPPSDRVHRVQSIGIYDEFLEIAGSRNLFRESELEKVEPSRVGVGIDYRTGKVVYKVYQRSALPEDATEYPDRLEDRKVLSTQEGGNHYKDMKIQPIEYIMANNIPFPEGNIIKYVSRWRKKGGVGDLRKARHMLDVLIEHEEKTCCT